MLKWQTNTEPIRFPFRWILGIPVLLLLSIATSKAVYAYAAKKTLSGNPPGDMPVILIIGAVVVVGAVWRRLDWIRGMRGR